MIQRIILPLVGSLSLLCGLQAFILSYHTPIFRGFQDILVIQNRFSTSPKNDFSSELVMSLGRFQTSIQQASEASLLTHLPGSSPVWKVYQEKLDSYLGSFLHYQSLMEQTLSLEDRISVLSSTILNRLTQGGYPSDLDLKIRRTSLEAARQVSKGHLDPEVRTDIIRLSQEGQVLAQKSSQVQGLSPEQELTLFRISSQTDAIAETAGKAVELMTALDQARGQLVLSAQGVLDVQTDAAEHWRFQLLMFQFFGVLGLVAVTILGTSGFKVGRKPGP